MDWPKSRSRPLGPSKIPRGPVMPRCANAVVYTARCAVMPGDIPFQFDTGSEWIAASDTLSAAAIAMALAVCPAVR